MPRFVGAPSPNLGGALDLFADVVRNPAFAPNEVERLRTSLLTSIAVDKFCLASARVRRYYRTIEIVSGVLLVLLGVLIFTDKFTILSRFLTPYLHVY